MGDFELVQCNHRLPKIAGTNEPKGNCFITYHVGCLRNYFYEQSELNKDICKPDTPYWVYCPTCVLNGASYKLDEGHLNKPNIKNIWECLPEEKKQEVRNRV